MGIGSNLQSPRERVLEAVERMGRAAGHAHGTAFAPVSDPPPWGPGISRTSLNAAVGLLTQLSAADLLDGLLRIETQHGP